MWTYEQFADELTAAVEHENLVRDAGMLGIPAHIGDFKVQQMTVRHYVILKIAQNPFIFRHRLPEEEDLAQLLLVLRPKGSRLSNALFWIRCREFCLTRPPRFGFPLRMWRRRASERIERFVSLCKSADEYIQETFQDRPPQDVDNEFGQDYYSHAASICAVLAREYGGGPMRYLDIPLTVAFQLLNEIREMWAARANRRALLFNPSDRVRREFLEQLNQN